MTNKYNSIYNTAHKSNDLFSMGSGIGGRRRFADLASKDSDVYEFSGGAFNKAKPSISPGATPAPPASGLPDGMSMEDFTALAKSQGLTPQSQGGMAGLMNSARAHPGMAIGGGVAAGMVGSNMMGGRRGY